MAAVGLKNRSDALNFAEEMLGSLFWVPLIRSNECDKTNDSSLGRCCLLLPSHVPLYHVFSCNQFNTLKTPDLARLISLDWFCPQVSLCFFINSLLLPYIMSYCHMINKRDNTRSQRHTCNPAFFIPYIYRTKNTVCKTFEYYRLQTAIFSRETENKKMEAGLYLQGSHSRSHTVWYNSVAKQMPIHTALL